MTYQFHPAAANEYLESIAFYESRLAGLGADFIAEFESTHGACMYSAVELSAGLSSGYTQGRIATFPI
jgi:hypothetical protein